MEIEPTNELTPERIAILVEFADNLAAGRKMMRGIAYCAVVMSGVTAFIYYVVNIIRTARGAGLH